MNNNFLKLLLVLVCLFIATFFNHLLSLYSGVDLFKINFVKKKKEGRKIKKLIYVLKNISLFFLVNSFCQLFLGLIISELATSITEEFLPTIGKIKKLVSLFLFGITIVIFTELLPRYLVRKSSEKTILNNFFLEFIYGVIRLFSWLKFIIKPQKRLFVNNEQDVIRFVKNLTLEGILERKEVRLIEAAFSFDEERVDKFLVPRKKMVFLTLDMDYKEVQEIYLQHFFTNYPVFNDQKKVVGVFNGTVFNWICLKKKNPRWQDYITKEVAVRPSMKLNKVFEKLQKNSCQMAIVREKEKIYGIITLKGILGTLVGKIQDEKQQLMSLRRGYN